MPMLKYRATKEFANDEKTVQKKEIVRLLAMTSELVTVLKNTGEIVNVPMVVFGESFEQCI